MVRRLSRRPRKVRSVRVIHLGPLNQLLEPSPCLLGFSMSRGVLGCKSAGDVRQREVRSALGGSAFVGIDKVNEPGHGWRSTEYQVVWGRNDREVENDSYIYSTLIPGTWAPGLLGSGLAGWRAGGREAR